MTRDDLMTLAEYNMWANDRMVKACAEVPDRDYFADKGAFFGSMHNTLNHLLVTDRLWLARMQGEPPEDYRLDEVLFDDFQSTRKARLAQDRALMKHVASLTDEEVMANVFTPFFSTKKKWGTGLGLALTSRIINLHNGQITVESELDKGTVFRITLPVDGKGENLEDGR